MTVRATIGRRVWYGWFFVVPAALVTWSVAIFISAKLLRAIL